MENYRHFIVLHYILGCEFLDLSRLYFLVDLENAERLPKKN